MKKAIGFFICTIMILTLCACTPKSVPEGETATAKPGFTQCPVSASVQTSATPVASADTPSAEATPTASGPEMYTSYARLVSFDPSTGIAQFDYFDILKGTEAVDYLVANEGYTEAEAQALVDEFADSEFVEGNADDELRAIDIDDVSLSLMYQPSGEQVAGPEPVPSTASDFRAIYTFDPSLLLDSFFYSVHVEGDGHVSLVEQVYWA